MVTRMGATDCMREKDDWSGNERHAQGGGVIDAGIGDPAWPAPRADIEDGLYRGRTHFGSAAVAQRSLVGSQQQIRGGVQRMIRRQGFATKTSRAAPAIQPSLSARARAVSSTTAPRAVLMSIAPGFIARNCVSPI